MLLLNDFIWESRGAYSLASSQAFLFFIKVTTKNQKKRQESKKGNVVYEIT